MKLVCKERLFSRFRGYRVYDDDGKLVFVVKSRPFLERRLDICDADGKKMAHLREKRTTWPAEFEMYVSDSHVGERYIGYVTIAEQLQRTKYIVSCNGWSIESEWDVNEHTVIDPAGKAVAFVEWKPFGFSRYVINVMQEEHLLLILMFALATDVRFWRLGWWFRFV